MKSIILLLFVMSFASLAIQAQKYKHKSEDEIAALTPAQRVDEYDNEWAHHRYDVMDKQIRLIGKYVLLDGIEALPRIIEIIDEYDPTHSSNKRKGLRFDAAWMLLGDLDEHVFRVRSTDKGKQAIDAFERSIERMRKAGYGQNKQEGWERYGRVDYCSINLKELKGVNDQDKDIRSTLRFVYKIKLSDEELSEYSQYMTTHFPDYPSWSEGEMVKDDTDIAPDGRPAMNRILKKPERYYEAYLEFKKLKQ